MSEQLSDNSMENDVADNILRERAADEAGKITVLEALAEESTLTGVSRSNMSTPSAADADDQ
ncbi:MAG: hypothetical protein U0524_01655 [Candidatus Saccharimonadales bacterium]